MRRHRAVSETASITFKDDVTTRLISNDPYDCRRSCSLVADWRRRLSGILASALRSQAARRW